MNWAGKTIILSTVIVLVSMILVPPWVKTVEMEVLEYSERAGYRLLFLPNKRLGWISGNSQKKSTEPSRFTREELHSELIRRGFTPQQIAIRTTYLDCFGFLHVDITRLVLQCVAAVVAGLGLFSCVNKRKLVVE